MDDQEFQKYHDSIFGTMTNPASIYHTESPLPKYDGDQAMANIMNTGALKYISTEPEKGTFDNIKDFVFQNTPASSPDEDIYMFGARVLADVADRISPANILATNRSVTSVFANSTGIEDVAKSLIKDDYKARQVYADYFYGQDDKRELIKKMREYKLPDISAIQDEKDSGDLWYKAATIVQRLDKLKKVSGMLDANGQLDMAKVYEQMPYLKNVQEKYGTNGAVMALREAKGLQVITDVYKNQFSQFGGSITTAAQRTWLNSQNEYVGGKALFRGLMENKGLTDEELRAVKENDKNLEALPGYSYSNVGAALGGVAGNIVEQTPLMAAGVLNKVPYVGKAAAVTSMGLMIAGNQYLENLNKVDKNGRPMYTPRQAAMLSLAQGMAEGGLEQWQIEQILGALTRASGSAGLKSIISDAIVSNDLKITAGGITVDEAVKQAIKSRIGVMAESSATFMKSELAEEFWQQTADMFLENIAQVSIKGSEAELSSVDEILRESIGAAADALPAVAGFGIMGMAGGEVANTRIGQRLFSGGNNPYTISGARQHITALMTNKIYRNSVENQQRANIIDGVATNLDNIQELQNKAPDIVTDILDAQNDEHGMKETSVDVLTLRQEAGDEVVNAIAEANGISREELNACLASEPHMLTVSTSSLQQLAAKFDDAKKKALRNNIAKPGTEGLTNKQTADMLDAMREAMKAISGQTDKDTKTSISNFIKGNFAENLQPLAEEILTANIERPVAEVRRRKKQIQAQIDNILSGTIAQLKQGYGQGVDVVDIVTNTPSKYNLETTAPESEEEQQYYNEIKNTLDGLMAQRDALTDIENVVKDIQPGDIIATAVLSPEARQIYTMQLNALRQGNKEVSATARAAAILSARMADRLAAYAREAGQEGVTALDFATRVIPNAMEDATGGLMQEVNKQAEEIRAKYEGTDQWLKAPNGKESNLPERLWCVVRTEAFKNWFGDWEAAAVAKTAYDFFKNNLPVGKISGNEFGKETVSLIDRVENYYKSIGKEIVVNSELGDVKLDREGIKDSLGHGLGRMKAAAYALVPDVIEKGKICMRAANWKGRGYDTALIVAPVKIGNERYVCEVIVKQGKQRQGFYLHEVTIQKDLESVFKTANGSTLPRSKSIIADYAGKGKGCSKVVDENGEPKVMYHGTPYGGFDTFKVESYFTADKEYADIYQNPSASSNRSYYEPATNPMTYAVFLNIKKPFDTRIPEIRKIFENEFYRKWGNGAPLSDKGLPDWTDATDLLEFIEENGYDFDGIMLDEGATGGYGSEVKSRGVSYVPVNPTQIKSVDNNGNFDVTNPNIYKQVSEEISNGGYDPRSNVPKVRGGWTKNKILRFLKQHSTFGGRSKATKAIAEFNNLQELKDHIFYHGSAFGSEHLKPSITMSDREVERIGGGGYGDKYWGISVSKSKKIASRFSGMSRTVNIYPIILYKNAKVIEMPNLTDALDLDEHIEQLWNDGVDAVWIGDKNSGEQELCVINPNAVVNIGTPDFYKVYKLGTEENPINIKDDAQLQQMLDYAKSLVANGRGAPRDTDYNAPHKYLSGINRNPNYDAEYAEWIKTDDFKAYQQAMIEYRKEIFFQETKGSYSPAENAIRLFDIADQSTFMHESSHAYLTYLQQLAEQFPDSQAAKDYNAIITWAAWQEGQAREYAGSKSAAEFMRREAEIQAALRDGFVERTIEVNGEKRAVRLTADQVKAEWAQERFARAFEEYLRKGEPPAPGLQRVFRRFKEWLTKIYGLVTGAGVRATPEVEAVMARMVATDAEIETAAMLKNAHRINRVNPDLMDSDTAAMMERWETEAKEQAKEKLLKELIAEYEAADIEAYLKEFRDGITENFKNLKCYQAEAVADARGEQAVVDMGYYPSVEAWKEDREQYGGPLQQAIDKAVAEEREAYKTRMPGGEELAQRAEEAILSGEYNERLTALEQAILDRRRDKYAKAPAQLIKAFEDAENAKDDTELNKALLALKYATQWEKEQSQEIADLIKLAKELQTESEQNAAAASEAGQQNEAQAEEIAKLEKRKEKLRADLIKRIQALKQKTALNTQWLRAVRDASKGIYKAQREAARQRLETMPVSSAIKTRYYINQAHKAAQESANLIVKASRAKDEAERNRLYDAARKAKQQQSFYEAMARESLKLKKELQKTERNFDRKTSAMTKDKEHKIDIKHKYYIGHLLYVFGYRKYDMIRPNNLDDFNDFMKILQANLDDPDGEYVPPDWLMSAVIGDKQVKKYTDISIDELRDLNAFINFLYTTGKHSKKLMTTGEEIAEVVKYLASDWMRSTAAAGSEENPIAKQMVQLLKPELMLKVLGGRNGSWIKYFYKPLFEAMDKKRQMQEAEAETIVNLYNQFYSVKERQKMVDDKVIDFKGEELTKENILAMALNWGNKGNRGRLVAGFNRDNRYHITESNIEMEIFQKYMTEKDWQFVQTIWDHIGQYGDEVNKVVEKCTGNSMKRVEPDSFTIQSADGKTVSLKGGYYPVKYDPEKSTRQIENDITTAGQAVGGASAFGTGMGSTKARNARVPDIGGLLLNLDVINNHINQQIHIIAMRVACRDVYKLLNDKSVKSMITQTLGNEAYIQLKEWCENTWAEPRRDRIAVLSVLARLRSKTVAAIMGYRLSTALLNFANVAPMADKIGAVNTATAMVHYIMHPQATRRFVLADSSFMRDRAHNIDRDLNKQQENLFGGQDTIKYKIDKYANWLIEETDMLCSIPLYYWQYQQSFNAAKEAGKSEADAAKEAHFDAHEAVRDVFGSADIIDQSQIQRTKNEMVKLITPFFSFFNAQMNAVWLKYYEGKYAGKVVAQEQADGTTKFVPVRDTFVARYSAFAHSWIMRFVVMAAIETVIRQAMSSASGDDDKDKDKWYKKFAKEFAKNSMDSALGGFPIIRDISSAAMQYAFGGKYQSRSVGVVEAAFERYTEPFITLNKTIQGKKDLIDLGRSITRAADSWYGIPDTLTDAIWNTARFVTDNYHFNNPNDLREYIGKTLLDKKLKGKNQK